MYVEVTVIFFWSLGKRAAPIDEKKTNRNAEDYHISTNENTRITSQHVELQEPNGPVLVCLRGQTRCSTKTSQQMAKSRDAMFYLYLSPSRGGEYGVHLVDYGIKAPCALSKTYMSKI